MGEWRKGGRDFGPNCTEEEAAGVRGEGWRLMAMLPKVGPFQEAHSTRWPGWWATWNWFIDGTHVTDASVAKRASKD